MHKHTNCAYLTLINADGVDKQSSGSNDGFISVFRATHAHKQAAEASIKLASITVSDVIYDLGCGDARSAWALT